jgi:hypothetical protein
MTAPRQPNQTDLLKLAKALADFDVEYVVIGGAAMALHGFPRMTKDIDLLLPVDSINNARLLRALESMPENKEALATLRPEWMDKGHSTALEGDLYIDLLYVAASKSFDELREHVQTVVLNGIPVVTLDVDGMLLTKKTARESDIPDRVKLGRLRRAKQELAVQTERTARLPALANSCGAAYIFWRLATEAIKQAGGDASAVGWQEVEEATIREAIGKQAQTPESVREVLIQHSPGVMSGEFQDAVSRKIDELAPQLQVEYGWMKKLEQADEHAVNLHPTDIRKQNAARREEALRLGIPAKDYDRLSGNGRTGVSKPGSGLDL